MRDFWDHGGRILGGQQYTGIHEKIEEWIEKIPGAHFSKGGGISYLNGKIYHHDVVFQSEEDLLAFKLAFHGSVA